jgi:hypothetical protein
MENSLSQSFSVATVEVTDEARESVVWAIDDAETVVGSRGAVPANE